MQVKVLTNFRPAAEMPIIDLSQIIVAVCADNCPVRKKKFMTNDKANPNASEETTHRGLCLLRLLGRR